MERTYTLLIGKNDDGTWSTEIRDNDMNLVAASGDTETMTMAMAIITADLRTHLHVNGELPTDKGA